MKKFKKIYIEITNNCNLNCPFCSKDKRESRELSLKEFEIILKKIDNYTDYVYLHVLGEPLLHSQFKDILKLCQKYNKKVNITTNGILLEKQINHLINSSVRQINISLQSVINIKYVEKIIKCADVLAKNGIQIVYRMWVKNKYQKDIIMLIETHYQIIINQDNQKLTNNIYFNKDKEFIWPNLNNSILRKEGTCYGTRTHIGILSDGTVIPCCLDSGGNINLGNIFKDNFEDIINSKRYLAMKENFQNNKLVEELCKKCGFCDRKNIN